MSIRIRTVNGVRVALCAAETDPEPGDIYLDDVDHHALSAKFTQDFASMHPHMSSPDWLLKCEYPEEWAAMASQKRRDAVEELEHWSREVNGGGS